MGRGSYLRSPPNTATLATCSGFLFAPLSHGATGAKSDNEGGQDIGPVAARAGDVQAPPVITDEA
jgi:hypothetical protein